MHLQIYASSDTPAVVDASHTESDAHGLLKHSSTSMSQLPPKPEAKWSSCITSARLSLTLHSPATGVMKLYEHIPFAYPVTQRQRYAWNEISVSLVESEHAAPFVQGLLAHSFISISQLPLTLASNTLSSTAHSAANSEMKSYSHKPLAYPATQRQRYARSGTDVSVLESEQVAPFVQGLLLHSSKSTSQLPLIIEFSILFDMLHSAVYSEMKVYSHMPFAKPSTQRQVYACHGIPVSVVESEHVAPFTHGLLAHSSTSMSQFPLQLALYRLCVTVHPAV